VLAAIEFTSPRRLPSESTRLKVGRDGRFRSGLLWNFLDFASRLDPSEPANPRLDSSRSRCAEHARAGVNAGVVRSLAVSAWSVAEFDFQVVPRGGDACVSMSAAISMLAVNELRPIGALFVSGMPQFSTHCCALCFANILIAVRISS
jgi:hypothetical protein